VILHLNQDRGTVRLIAAAVSAGRSGCAVVKPRSPYARSTDIRHFSLMTNLTVQFPSAEIECVPVQVSIEMLEFENGRTKPHLQTAVHTSLLQEPVISECDGTDR